MLKITTHPNEVFDEETGEFRVYPSRTLRFEHSLVSISKWEAFHEKSFWSKDPRTLEESLYYIWCMCLDDVELADIHLLGVADQNQCMKYISSKQSATTFHGGNKDGGQQTVTSELVYHWMIQLDIPFSCETWNINRLMNLIRICGIKNNPKNKMSAREQAEWRRAENARRKAGR